MITEWRGASSSSGAHAPCSPTSLAVGRAGLDQSPGAGETGWEKSDTTDSIIIRGQKRGIWGLKLLQGQVEAGLLEETKWAQTKRKEQSPGSG